MGLTTRSLIRVIKERVGFHDPIVFAATFLLFRQQASGFADDPGVGWHLKTGEWIVSHLNVPRIDPFLFSPQPRPWVCHQWLSDVVLYLLHSLGSWELLYSVILLIFLFNWCGLLYYGVRRGIPYTAVSVGVLLGLKASLVHFILRPVVFGFLFFSMVYLACLQIDRHLRFGGVGALRSRWIYFGLPLIFTIWANMHPSFVFGFALLGAVLFSVMIGSWQRKDKYSWKSLGGVAILLGVCFLATLINPYGWGLHAEILFHPDSAILSQVTFGDMRQFIHEEWLPVDPFSLEGECYLVMLAIALLGGIFCAFRKWSVFDAFCLLGFAEGVRRAVRMLPYFGVISVRPFSVGLGELFGRLFSGRTGPMAKVARTWKVIEEREQKARSGFFALSVSLIIVVGVGLTGAYSVKQLGPSEDRYPYAAFRQLKSLATKAGLVGVVSPPAWGGFITFLGEGKIRPIVDDRNNVFGESSYQEFHSYLQGRAGWQDYFRSLNADYLLLPVKGPLVHVLHEKPEQSPGFQVIYQDEISLLVAVSSSNPIIP